MPDKMDRNVNRADGGADKKFDVIHVAGDSPGEVGRDYGRKARDLIERCIETYREHFRRLQDLRWEDARVDAARYLPLVEAALPVETEMLRGAAEGAEVPFADILVLNTRYEMLHYPKNECTTYAVLREASRDGHVYVGQNWDQRPVMTPHSLVLHITMPDGMRIMGVTEAGQLLRNGMNSHGLGLVASGLNSSLDRRQVGIPGNFMRMRALRSHTFGEMAEFVISSARAVANNYCLASACNRALDVEAIPERPFLIRPERGVVTHANHILGEPALDISKGKKFRGERLGELLRARAGEIDIETIKGALADHHGYPDSVCSHISEDRTDMHRAWMTVASMIYDLDALEMHICRDNPCEGTYRRLKLAD